MAKKVDPDTEKRVLEILPLVANFIKGKKQLTENQYKALAKFHSAAFEWARNSTLDEIYKFEESHRGHRIYGDHIELLLTPEGKRFTKYLHELSQKWAP